MGIQNRDYYRESTRGMFDDWARSRVTVWIIALTCGVFFGQCIDGPPWASDLVRWGGRDAQKILDGEVWRAVTSVFLHGGLWHLFFNMLVLYWAGSQFEELYGSKEMVAFYFGAAVFTSALFVLAQFAAPGPVPIGRGIGASVSVMAVLVVFAFHYPHQQVLLFGILPMPVWLLVVAYIGFDLSGAMGAMGNLGIGHLAHLGGALFGLLYYQSGWRLTAVFTRSPNRAKRRRAPALRLVPVDPPELNAPEPATVVPPSPRPVDSTDEPFEVKVDRVLAKVSALGQESLTAEEREILFRAGEVYKKRRK
jgi:membrane associated rhomboid family serine protease